MTTVLLLIAIFLAAAVQALTGFGFALVVMPLVTLVVSLREAAPLVALAGLTLYSINLVRFRRSVDLPQVMRLAAASALGIPVGLWVLTTVDEGIIKPLLGMVVTTYALYALFRPDTPRICAPWWVYPAGFLAGCLGGAYNTPGPPVIVYGSLRQWPKQQFRAILQTLFFVNGVLVVVSHALAGNLTPGVMIRYYYAVPALLLGVLVGALLDSRVDSTHFRQLVAVLILLLGLSLLLGSFLK
jgi:uncharacterized membrane protein YfcA